MRSTARSQNTTSRPRFGAGKSDDMRDDEKAPRAERDDLKDADNVVDGRVICSLLVAVVETVNPREQHPERERCDEEREPPMQERRGLPLTPEAQA